MKTPVDTQALLWLKALKKEIREIDRDLERCIHGQTAGRLSQAEFDEFRDQVTDLAHKIIASTEGG